MVVEVLANTELFDALLPGELEGLAEQARERRLARNDVLFHEHDEANEMFVVTEGRLAVTRGSVDGRESVLALMEPGDLVGEMPLFDGQSRSTDVRALEPSMVVAVPYEPIRELYAQRPELLWRVVTLLSLRLRVTDDALADSMFLDVAGRTAKRLLELSGGQDSFLLPVTQEELAGMVGASRERVNKALASFSRLGWIVQQDRRYTISDREALTLRSC
jgi:CRP/FNR family transcriptional regulator, cyclic AMP receptor protein